MADIKYTIVFDTKAAAESRSGREGWPHVRGEDGQAAKARPIGQGGLQSSRFGHPGAINF